MKCTELEAGTFFASEGVIYIKANACESFCAVSIGGDPSYENLDVDHVMGGKFCGTCRTCGTPLLCIGVKPGDEDATCEQCKSTFGDRLDQDYYEKHSLCPACGKEPDGPTTTMGYLFGRDRNSTCCSCGWSGVVDDLKPNGR